MKFQTTAAFDRDFKRLPTQHRKKFRDLIPRFHAAAERVAAGQSDPWPNGMPIKPVKSAPGVRELTWSKHDPDDGRATWEWAQVDGEAAVLCRRIGDHGVFDDA